MESIEKLEGLIGKHGGVYTDAKPLILAFALAIFAFLIIAPTQTWRNFQLTFFLAPLWMPVILYNYALKRFIQSRQAAFQARQKYILLELRLPRDTMKPLLAMETFFSNMNFGPGESNWYKRIWLGGLRPSWSFEIASLGGQVHFYIWTREAQRRGLEAYLYAQFPDMEIIEAEDYARLTDPSDGEHSMFGEEYVKKLPDPFPIKTYVAYGLDKTGNKPEEQVDPLTQLIEILGSVGPKEQFWVQLIVRQSKNEKYAHKPDWKDWKDHGKELIDKIRSETVKKMKYTDPTTGKVIETEGFPNPTKGQNETIAAIESNTNKAAFDVGIRVIYSATKDAYQGAMANFVIPLFKPFSHEAGNSIGILGRYSAGFQDYPWEDPHRLMHEWAEKRLLRFYRHRAYFADPYTGPYSIMSSEELATLYHIPSSTIATPTLPRIQSATTGAPPNLPI